MTDYDKDQIMYSILKQFSTWGLEELIRFDACSDGSDDTDSDYISIALEVLAERERENPLSTAFMVEEAWEKFEKHYLPHSGMGGSIFDWDEDEDETADIPNK